MQAQRRYHLDPLALDVDAQVVAHLTVQGRAGVVLDDSPFYPESGGQPGDQGVLDGLAVTDVQAADDGRVVVLVGGAQLPAVGARVRGRVDAARRRQNMSLHTAQHMLSRAFLDRLGAETVSSRLSASASTIDLDVSSLDEAAALDAVQCVQRAVDEDRPVRQWFPEAAELAGLPLRRRPKVEDNVRVVSIEGFDVSPCGGTHCTHTAQVGPVTLLSIERYKGKMRVSFLSGAAALRELEARARVAVSLGRRFSCGPFEAAAAVDKLQSDLAEARALATRFRAHWAERRAQEALAASPDGRVRLALEEGGQDELRALGAAITAKPEALAMLAAPSADGWRVLIARGAASGFDCGAFLKALARETQGRGGGSPQRAEGVLPAGVEVLRCFREAP